MRIARSMFLVPFMMALLSWSPVFAQGPSGNAPGLEASGGPLAEVAEKLHDFGEMSVGQEYTYGFVIKNIGTAPLEIKKVIKV